MAIYDEEWLKAPKAIDSDFSGSLSERLGYNRLICPKCGSHLFGKEDEPMCLNACHLTQEGRNRLHATLASAAAVVSAISEPVSVTDQARRRRRRHKRTVKKGA